MLAERPRSGNHGRVSGADHDVLTDVSRLVHAWCDRRELRALARLLPAWSANNGLTDGWSDVLDALRTIRADGGLPDDEVFRVERCEALVQNNQLGALQERARDVDAAALAMRELPSSFSYHLHETARHAIEEIT